MPHLNKIPYHIGTPYLIKEGMPNLVIYLSHTSGVSLTTQDTRKSWALFGHSSQFNTFIEFQASEPWYCLNHLL